MDEVRKALEPWINYSRDVMIKNLEFLTRNYRDVIDSCYDLLNDIIDIGMWIMPSKTLSEEKRMNMLTKYLMYPMLIHVVYPNLNFLPIAVLLGALPQAFYTIRTALEAFVVTLYADNKEELRDLPWFEKVGHKSVRNVTVSGVKCSLYKILAKVFRDKESSEWVNYILDLYQAVSAWVHPVARIRIDKREELAAGIIRAVMITTAERGIPPVYGIVIPMEYTDEDLEDLKHLNDIINFTRLATSLIAYAWSIDKDVADGEALRKHFEKLLEMMKSVKKPS